MHCNTRTGLLNQVNVVQIFHGRLPFCPFESMSILIDEYMFVSKGNLTVLPSRADSSDKMDWSSGYKGKNQGTNLVQRLSRNSQVHFTSKKQSMNWTSWSVQSSLPYWHVTNGVKNRNCLAFLYFDDSFSWKNRIIFGRTNYLIIFSDIDHI